MDAPLNEETVKNRYLVPWLLDLGFDPSELRFEEHLSLRVGRKTIQCPSVSGRLDILVQRDNENLFVVEAKRQGAGLTDDDRDQGISYASLVRPMAPFVVVTNGDLFRVYDTVSEEEISGKTISPSSDFKVSLPQQRVERAIKHFLGLSPANLAAFCRAQVDEEMLPLLGSRDRRQAKFIPELFVERRDFSNAVRQFANERGALFFLVADSGAGKTCCLCHLARQRLDQGLPVLFYRGTNLKDGILATVAADFGWTFSESQSKTQLVRRLSDLLATERLLIVIDGVDEWPEPGRRQDLLDSAKRLSAFDNIRLVVSCKTSAWHRFVVSRGTETGLSKYLARDAEGNTKPHVLDPLSPQEFADALKKYREFYGVGRYFEDAALSEAKRNSFFMRVLFEVAEARGEETITLSSTDYLEEYLQQVVGRTAQPETARIVLTAVARELFLRGREQILDTELAQLVEMAGRDAVLEELVEYQVLEKAPANPGAQISFYFSLLRDYVVAFHSQRWHSNTDQEFGQALADLSESPVHQEAIVLFYRYAAPERQRQIDSAARSRAETILHIYNEVLTTDLPALRSHFAPYTTGRIGYVGTFSPATGELGFAEFRELGDGDEEVLLLPSLAQRLYDSNLPTLFGGRRLVGVTAPENRDPRQWTLNQAIGVQLRALVDRGRLRESSQPKMLVEAVLGMITATGRQHGDEPHPAFIHRTPPNRPRRVRDILPIETKSVRKWLRWRLLYWQFQEQRIEEKLESGEIPVQHRENGSITYSADLTYEDIQDFAREFEAVAHLDETTFRQFLSRTRERGLRLLDDRLTEVLNDLEIHGIEELDEELFPERHELRPWHETEKVCGFIERALTLAIEACRSIARENFPTTCDYFPIVRLQPLTVVVEVHPNDCADRLPDSATVYLCEASSSTDRVVVKPSAEVRTSFVRQPSWRFDVETGGETFVRLEMPGSDGVSSQRYLRLGRLLYGSHYLGIQPSIHSVPRIPSTLRTLVYDWLRAELPLAFRMLCEKCDVEMDESAWRFFAQP